jgi:CDP-glucose 4,6-dehydratase
MLAERLTQDAPAFASGWNFGPQDDDAKPVSWIADRLVRAWGGSASWVQDPADHQKEAGVLRLDASRAKALLEWEPQLPLERALDWIVEWYQACSSGTDLRQLTQEQIERYDSSVDHDEGARL